MDSVADWFSSLTTLGCTVVGKADCTLLGHLPIKNDCPSHRFQMSSTVIPVNAALMEPCRLSGVFPLVHVHQTTWTVIQKSVELRLGLNPTILETFCDGRRSVGEASAESP